ncbi:MAG: T9SS type A sorting domain-containing protein [Bacteroidota bacterium]|nr:T9SS type A sorting domain-containing protein [Bacteroidota bacterium]
MTPIFLVLFTLASVGDAQVIWQKLNGPTDHSIQCIAIDTSGHLFVGTQNIGVYRSTDDGNTWQARIQNGNDPRALAISPSGIIFCGSWGACVQRSTDNGLNWKNVTGNMTNKQVLTLAIKSDGTIFTSSTGLSSCVYCSTDSGASWASSWAAGTLTEWVKTFAFGSDGTVYAGGTGIHYSTDNGSTWQYPLQRYTINALVINAGGEIFAGTESNGLLTSTDKGKSWSLPTLSGLTVKALIIDPKGRIYAGTTTGKVSAIYQSSDAGATWTETDSGMSKSTVSCFAIGPNGHLYAGTGGGVYETTGSVAAEEKVEKAVPQAFSLSQNYPNPFNPTTTIEYAVSSKQYVWLNVYNVLGEKVATLVNETKSAGRYHAKFDGSSLPSGVYFYRIQAATYTETKKLLLMK